MQISANHPEDISSAYSSYYSQLADLFAERVKRFRPWIILEAGCGKGQLTLPLIRRLPIKTKIIGVDSSRGPYRGWLRELESELDREGLTNRVTLFKQDVRDMTNIADASIDVIVSNELICDLPQERQLGNALDEFNRVLRPGGGMIHAEWSSPTALERKSRQMVVKHWPTWNPDQLFSQLKQAKYQEVRITYFNTTIKFEYKAAIQELQTWGASEKMIRKHLGALKNNGILLPYQHIVESKK